jgi:glycosyltransferase involved in cell wall biosynthesis
VHVGIFFNARRTQGGLYQYATTLVHCLQAEDGDGAYTVFDASAEGLPFAIEAPGWRLVRLGRAAVATRLLPEGLVHVLARLGWRRPLRVIPEYGEVRGAGLDVMLYVKPSVHSFLWRTPAVFPIHDLQHLEQPEFPEVSAAGERARREFLYRNAVPSAAGVLADSELGREDIIAAYGARPERVHALPHLAPSYLRPDVTPADRQRVASRYALAPGFLFYPAAFWPHKNHARLLRALRRLNDERGARLTLVLAGRLDREYAALRRLVEELSLGEQVRFLGYVPDEDLFPLYGLALALVMPTLFGPTNIPNLEAWSLGCPLITSDVRGLHEYVGDAGVLVDPRDDRSIAEGIWRVHADPELRLRLAERGREKVAAWTPRDFVARLRAVLAAARA